VSCEPNGWKFKIGGSCGNRACVIGRHLSVLALVVAPIVGLMGGIAWLEAGVKEFGGVIAFIVGIAAFVLDRVEIPWSNSFALSYQAAPFDRVRLARCS
jgi:hypothetical protein